ncbi:MAG: DUF58 domain-containing protein [Spirochaetota bacterium]
MILPELEALIKQLEFRQRRKLRSEKHGNYLHHRPGRGMDFKDVRLYAYGDDIRFIDWNVTSRMGDVYVKEFYEENDRLVNIFFDISESMSYAAANEQSKFFMGFQFFAFLTLLSLYAGDRINLILYAEGQEVLHQNIRTKESAYKILQQIYQRGVSKKKTKHEIPFRLLKERFSRRSVAYVISDFAGIKNLDAYNPLREIHDLYGIRVFDSSETLVDEKIYRYFFLKRVEGGAEGDSYQNSFLRENEALKNFFRLNFLELRTDSEIAKTIIGFLTGR